MRRLCFLLMFMFVAFAFVPPVQADAIGNPVEWTSPGGGGPPPPPPGNPSGGLLYPGTTVLAVSDWWSNVVSFHVDVGPTVSAVTWFFGDGTSADGISVTHPYPVSGFYASYAVRVHICTPNVCEDLWKTVQVFNGPLIVVAGLGIVTGVVLGLVIASVLRQSPKRAGFLPRLRSRSKLMRRKLELGGRVHAKSIRRLKTVRLRVRGR